MTGVLMISSIKDWCIDDQLYKWLVYWWSAL